MTHGGKLVTLIGQSGSGKTTQMRELVALRGFRQSPNITTRRPRPSDLPKEYTYLDAVAYEALMQRPGRLLWDVRHGDAHYAKDVCDVIEALTDSGERGNTYVHSLVPEAAQTLVGRYGSDLIKTIMLPNPGDDELYTRMINRGDTPAEASARLNFEATQDWELAIDGLQVVTATSIRGITQEIVDMLR